MGTNMRQIPQSRNLFNHQAYPGLLLNMESDFNEPILNEDIDDLLDESPELSDDEGAALDTPNLGLEIVSTFSCTDSVVDERKKATNQEGGANENDTNMRQKIQSKNPFSHQAYPELLLSMESDFDDTIVNEDIDDLLDDESPELSNDEESVVDELINSPVKNSNLNIFTKDDSTTA